ncbi:MAG: hypothetical protein ACRELB_10255, partial [Polyangiaceae bacterium]
VVGNFNGTLNFGNTAMSAAGNGDIFLAKLDPTGNALWSHHFGDATSNSIGYTQEISADGAGASVITGALAGNADFGGGTLQGGQSGDIYPFIAKFNGAGTYAWAYAGNSLGSAAAVATDTATHVGVAGQFSASESFAGASLTQPTSAFVMKLTP